MPLNAKALKRLAHAAAGEPVPRAPKQPARGIMSFFSSAPPKKPRANESNEQDEEAAGSVRKKAKAAD